MDRGSTQLVIVALPREDDRVRKFSSEKEPHLTLLYLGKPDYNDEQITRIAEYVEYAASQIHTFGLDVVSRGELGDSKADVLFFNKKWSREITSFRLNLMQDPLISAAYNSSEQFPDWTPHLTMGFPGTPAKKDSENDYPHSYVQFDRIALWVGNSVGPTFPLKIYDYHDEEVAVAQSEQGRSAVSDVLASCGNELVHHGVKGMRWGVNRSGNTATVSEDHKNAVSARETIKTSGTKALSNKELQDVITRMNLEKQYNTMGSQNKSAIDRGNDRVKKVLALSKTYEEAQRFLASPSGRAVKNGLKGAFAAAKVAAAFKTGGASTAAAAGAGIAVRRMSNHYTNTGN